MVSVSSETVAALRAWLDPVNSDPSTAGITDDIATDVLAQSYGTIIGADASGWLLAVQTAVEQQADVVLVAGAGWGNPLLNRVKGRKLIDFSIWDTWGSGGTAGVAGEDVVEAAEDGTETVTSTSGSAGAAALGTITGLEKDKQQRDALLKETLKAITQEDQLRKAKGLPQPFVRDIFSYLRYTAPQVGEHLNTVIQEKSGAPSISFVCLLPSEGKPPADTVRNLRKLTAEHGGSLILFRGADNTEDLKRLNRDLQLSE
jgi:hypothetical protein